MKRDKGYDPYNSAANLRPLTLDFETFANETSETTANRKLREQVRTLIPKWAPVEFYGDVGRYRK